MENVQESLVVGSMLRKIKSKVRSKENMLAYTGGAGGGTICNGKFCGVSNVNSTV